MIVNSKKFLRLPIQFSALLIAFFCASHGLFEAIYAKKLLKGHDTSAYAIYITEFYDNFSKGILFPVWAQHLQFGYGEPQLQFRPPLQTYISQIFYALQSDSFTAIQSTAIFFVFMSGLGMYFLLKKMKAKPSACILGSAAYMNAPYVLADIYVRGAFSELAAFPAIVWFTSSLYLIFENPNTFYTGILALSFLTVAISHATALLVCTPITLMIILYLRLKNNPAYLSILLATILGLCASSYYWLSSLLETKFIKSALLAVDFESYIGHFVRIDQLIHMNWNFADGGINFSIGLFSLAGLLGCIALISYQRKIKPTLLFFFILAMSSLYLTHRVSAFWYELIPTLQLMSFPWRFLGFSAFFTSILSSLFYDEYVRTFDKKYYHSIAGLLFIIIIISGYIKASPLGFSEFTPEQFNGKNLAEKGFGWVKQANSPSSASILPQKMAKQPVEIINGRGELNCTRTSPIKMECEILVIQPSTIRFNSLDYPKWKTYIDEKPALTARTEALTSLILVTINPGKHKVRFELTRTPTRLTTQILSILSLSIILFLLLQNQIAKFKSLQPKRD